MELISHHQPEELGKGQKETPRVRPLPRIPLASIHLGWAMRAPQGKTELEWLATDHPETNPITIKPETASHMAEQLSWVSLPYCSPPRCPFPIKFSCFVSTCVSSDNSFPSVRQEPSFTQFLLTRRKGLPTFRDWNYLHQPRLLCLLDTRSPVFTQKWQTVQKSKKEQSLWEGNAV